MAKQRAATAKAKAAAAKQKAAKRDKATADKAKAAAARAKASAVKKSAAEAKKAAAAKAKAAASSARLAAAKKSAAAKVRADAERKKAASAKQKAVAAKKAERLAAAKARKVESTKRAAAKKAAIAARVAERREAIEQKAAAKRAAADKRDAERRAAAEQRAADKKAAAELRAAERAAKSAEKSNGVPVPDKKPRKAVRFAAGSRRPPKPDRDLPIFKTLAPAPAASAQAPAGADNRELNPRLERSTEIGSAAAAPMGKKPMSVAAKKRAEAEAMFAKFSNGPAEPAAPAPPSYKRPGFGAVRINERETLTTALRLSTVRDRTLDAARKLASQYQLPPDQTLLLKVIELEETDLTKLALEELLELDDRGRVRATPELKTTISQLRSRDPETEELRDLLLEKIGEVRAQ